jgi:hypothetical protein
MDDSALVAALTCLFKKKKMTQWLCSQKVQKYKLPYDANGVKKFTSRDLITITVGPGPKILNNMDVF